MTKDIKEENYITKILNFKKPDINFGLYYYIKVSMIKDDYN